MHPSVSRGFLVLLLWPLAAIADLASPQPPHGDNKAAVPFQTEQEWIVSSVCRNIFELLAYAKDKKGEAIEPSQVSSNEIAGATLTYDVTVKGTHETAEAKLQWPDSLWSAAAYVPFCQSVAKALKLPTAAPEKAQGNPLHTLLDFSEAVIESENQRVSHWLAEEPENAAAHEQAALILGALATKENSGYFWDPRDACNHIAAHMAVARFLLSGSNISVEGRLAECTVRLTADTKTQSVLELDQLAAEKVPPPDLQAWINAFRMRNTRDWRIVKSPEDASPLEQVEYFRARAEATNPDLAINWLRSHSIANRPDWTRIVLEMGFSVDAGHAFAENSVRQELHVMQTAFPLRFQGLLFNTDINEPPGDAVTFNGSQTGTPTVISHGAWAQFFQRNLCHEIAETGDFLANKWGVPDSAEQFDEAIKKIFSGLTYYPYLQLVQHHMRDTPSGAAAALALFNSHPEWGPDFLAWMQSPANPDSVKLHEAATAWFDPAVVHGTAYGAMSRATDAGWPKAEVDRLYAMAPLQIRVAQMEVESHYGTQFTFPQIQKIMGPLLDYYAAAIDQAKNAVGLTFDERVQIGEKSAGINPSNYSDLAKLYLNNHQEDKAAEAYQEWYDKAPDRVEVSNGIDWLVNYYYDHKKPDQAMALAKEAADVYSSRGLETMMHLLERMGRNDEAEQYGQKINERYNDSSALVSFYKQHADKGDGAFQKKLDDLTRTTFPQGMKKVTNASFSGPPESGMVFTSTSSSMQKFGLAAGQVIVALDGYTVQSEAQYVSIRALSSAPEMQFIIWDGKKYQAITATQPGRLFGVGMQDYHP